MSAYQDRKEAAEERADHIYERERDERLKALAQLGAAVVEILNWAELPANCHGYGKLGEIRKRASNLGLVEEKESAP